MRRLAAAVVSLAVAGFAIPGNGTAAAAVSDWAVTAAYTFQSSARTNASWGVQTPGDTVARITVDVPDDLPEVYIEVTDGPSRHARVVSGYAVFDVAKPLAAGQSFPSLDLAFSATQGSPTLWRTTLSSTTPARPTELTLAPLPARAAAGSPVRVSGTLTQAGKPITGHWVAIWEYRVEKCPDSPGYCRGRFLVLGSAQVDSSGNWSTTVRLPSTVPIVATYCSEASFCWDNPNTPAFTAVRNVSALWAPKVTPPAKVRAGRAAVYKVSLPAAVPGVPVRLQKRVGTHWRTIGSTTVGRTISIRATLRATGRVKIRAYVPAYSYYLFAADRGHGSLARRISAGTSPAKVVRVRH